MVGLRSPFSWPTDDPTALCTSKMVLNRQFMASVRVMRPPALRRYPSGKGSAVEYTR
jgi:hypothetical protein